MTPVLNPPKNELATPVDRFPPGILGKAWGEAEVASWRGMQVRKRSYADDVLARIDALRDQFDVLNYGELAYSDERFALMALRSRHWQAGLPNALITGGVHGYETSGVLGALEFLLAEAHNFAGRVNLLVAPCVSPWAYERVQRWNFDALDPNRNFREEGPAQESSLLMQLVHSQRQSWAMHLDLHETTDTDESEFRPALAARDGTVFEPGSIPDGFYLVDDSANPQPAFQAAIIRAVQQVTHIAPADERGEIIGSTVVAPGVIRYPLNGLGLCTSITGARYTSTTEVYPDSARATPAQCIAAQVAAVCAGLEFVVSAK